MLSYFTEVTSIMGDLEIFPGLDLPGGEEDPRHICGNFIMLLKEIWILRGGGGSLDSPDRPL